MRYISTRGQEASSGFTDVLLAGLARDGGLYLPIEYPKFDQGEVAGFKTMPYSEVAARIMAKFTDPDLDENDLHTMVRDAYAGFTHPEVAPLRPLGDEIYLCELFHGPTIAFKDYAMQVLARLFDHALAKTGQRAVILAATSGDTGSAALEAFKNRKAIDIFILYPNGRVSPVQERQMTGVNAPGAFAVALDGDFDDCQKIVKTLFGDLDFRDRIGLSAVNSINWARLMPQIIYYVTSALALGAPQKPISFAVPTGNFGNIFSGQVAATMGLPIETLVCASNRNDILTRFFHTGAMQREQVQPSLSPSMDIQVSSNFERFLFDMLGRNGPAVKKIMEEFARTGTFHLDRDRMGNATERFYAFRLDDDATLSEIRRTYDETSILIDPHTAVGLAAARNARSAGRIPQDQPIVTLACAHPAKFPDTVKQATGITPPLPEHLAELMTRPETKHQVINDAGEVAGLIEKLRRK